jgi:hypothetical protein
MADGKDVGAGAEDGAGADGKKGCLGRMLFNENPVLFGLNSFYLMLFKRTATWVFAGVTVGLVSILLFYLYQTRLNLGSAFVWSFAYFALGALGGFIFGVPKIVSNNTTGAHTLGEIAATTDATDKAVKKNIIQENTNLTQISDWLTKVIIGAGLVQLKEIPGFIVEVSKKMARGISIDSLHPETFHSLAVLSGGIIVYFLTWGFVSGYLMMRLVIAELLSDV